MFMNSPDPNTSAAPLPAVSATQAAYESIRQMIITGELAPGEKLKIEHLKDRMETGSSPVREALTLLVSDQLVERLDQRGFRAAPVSQENFNEIFRLRCTLEELALRESIANATEQWEESLVLSHHHMARADSQDFAAFELRHKTFHMTLLACSASPILLRYCSQLYDLNVRYRYLAGRSKKYTRRDVASEHEGILNAAIARDADLTAARLMEHYQKTGTFLAEIPNKSEG
ncbi:GntR family transcriptional regulator [Neptunicoccus cionae]|uniref:GntR family transcriptional regulator n=1 Tax=Neptunicoccus cionae TaxID=2035344 RepID=UPI00256FA9E9|nr:GntR family transcriptional regulator [Amylibacter cionae]